MDNQVSSVIRTPWIIAPHWDLIFLIATPVLLIPAATFVSQGLSPIDLSLLVVIFATGHHFPTFLRTYGDRDLWQRYRIRLIMLPILLFAGQNLFLHWGWKGLELVLSLWAPWHGAMQLYGFMRIYDAKQGQVSSLTSGLDRSICTLGFLTILLWSPNYVYNLGVEFYSNGLPLPPSPWFLSFRGVVTAASIAIGLVYVVHSTWLLVNRQPISSLKWLLLANSLVTYYFAFGISSDAVVGLATWEVFHDIQYYAIVWAYNRRLVEKGTSATRALEFLFRPRFALLSLYLGLVFLYGGLDLGTAYVPMYWLSTAARNLFVVATLLHFYYDGFIWRVRQADTRKYLDVQEAAEAKAVAVPAVRQPRVWPRELRQVAYVMTPLLVLAITQNLFHPSELEAHRILAEIFPNAQTIHAQGRSLQDRERTEEAVACYRRALEHDPLYVQAKDDLGHYLVDHGQLQEGMGHLEFVLSQSERPTWFAKDIGDRRNPMRAEARAHGYQKLGVANQKLGRTAAAADHLWKAWHIGQPVVVLKQEIARDLSAVLLQQQRYADAVAVLRDAVDLGPDGRLFLAERLARILATCPDPQYRNPSEALALAESVCSTTGFLNPDALETLAHSYAALGAKQQAREVLQRLMQLSRRFGDEHRLQHSRQLLQEFEQMNAAADNPGP